MFVLEQCLGEQNVVLVHRCSTHDHLIFAILHNDCQGLSKADAVSGILDLKLRLIAVLGNVNSMSKCAMPDVP
jgi:hypothetical protein